MDSKELRELIDIISRSNFATFELEREGFRLKLVKGNSVPHPASAAPPQAGSPSLPAAETPSLASPEPAPGPSAPGLVELASPIVGTFYRAPGPDAPNFVEVGSHVRKAQILCIVEAMKLMNEIESEIDAEVVEILVANGQPVEYGEVLFRLRPL